MKAISSWAMALVIAAPSLAQEQEKVPAPILFSIRAGETLLLRTLTNNTASCEPYFTGFDGVDTMVGAPELSVNGEPGRVLGIFASGKTCPNSPGVKFFLTASKDISEKRRQISLCARAIRRKTAPKRSPCAFTC